MGAPDQVLGLRDRKKIQTRVTIRREAMRLIEENGYANTIVEQIAEAAEVSPSTFFRYFPSKEMVLMANDLDLVTVEALEQQPRDMPSLQAFRRALEITMATLSEDEWQFERARLKLVLSIPELKAAQFDGTAVPLRCSPRPIAAGPDANPMTSRSACSSARSQAD
jgi:AcrR family transcriptional regulator